MPARVIYRAPGMSTYLALTEDDMRDLHAGDTVDMFGVTFYRAD